MNLKDFKQVNIIRSCNLSRITRDYKSKQYLLMSSYPVFALLNSLQTSILVAFVRGFIFVDVTKQLYAVLSPISNISFLTFTGRFELFKTFAITIVLPTFILSYVFKLG